MPPVLSATAPMEQSVQELLAAAAPLGQFILALPPESPERERATVALNEALLWAHQAVARALAGPGRVMIASELPPN